MSAELTEIVLCGLPSLAVTHQAYDDPSLSPLAKETVSQCTNGPYLSSRAEREILHFQLHAKKRFLAFGEMTIATQSQGGDTEGVRAKGNARRGKFFSPSRAALRRFIERVAPNV